MFGLVLLVIFVSIDASRPRCGYDSCPKPKVNVPHILRQSDFYQYITFIIKEFLDFGIAVKTVLEYFSNFNNNISLTKTFGTLNLISGPLK